MCFVCSLAKQHAVFKWKDAISGLPVSQGSLQPLDRWGGKTKHRLISYFLSNTSAKNYRNRIVWVKIIARQRWDIFVRHVHTMIRIDAACCYRPSSVVCRSVCHSYEACKTAELIEMLFGPWAREHVLDEGPPDSPQKEAILGEMGGT